MSRHCSLSKGWIHASDSLCRHSGCYRPLNSSISRRKRRPCASSINGSYFGSCRQRFSVKQYFPACSPKPGWIFQSSYGTGASQKCMVATNLPAVSHRQKTRPAFCTGSSGSSGQTAGVVYRSRLGVGPLDRKNISFVVVFGCRPTSHWSLRLVGRFSLLNRKFQERPKFSPGAVIQASLLSGRILSFSSIPMDAVSCLLSCPRSFRFWLQQSDSVASDLTDSASQQPQSHTHASLKVLQPEN